MSEWNKDDAIKEAAQWSLQQEWDWRNLVPLTIKLDKIEQVLQAVAWIQDNPIRYYGPDEDGTAFLSTDKSCIELRSGYEELAYLFEIAAPALAYFLDKALEKE